MVARSFNVDGMSCNGCEQNVIEGLSGIDGVSEIEANHGTGSVEVEADSSVDDGTLVDAIETAGYDVVG